MTVRRTRQVLLMLAGLIVWAIQFTLVYGVTSTLCARGWASAQFGGVGVVPVAILAVTGLSLAAVLAFLLYALKLRSAWQANDGSGSDRFMYSAAALVSGLSLISIAWTGLPALILPACA